MNESAVQVKCSGLEKAINFVWRLAVAKMAWEFSAGAKTAIQFDNSAGDNGLKIWSVCELSQNGYGMGKSREKPNPAWSRQAGQMPA